MEAESLNLSPHAPRGSGALAVEQQPDDEEDQDEAADADAYAHVESPLLDYCRRGNGRTPAPFPADPLAEASARAEAPSEAGRVRRSLGEGGLRSSETRFKFAGLRGAA